MTPSVRYGFRFARYALLAGLACLNPGCSSASGEMERDADEAALRKWQGNGQRAAPRENASVAFRGAVGYGALSQGGRGGRVILVTSLDDSGPGSLRACMNEVGPRVCVFRIGGVIRFTGQPPIISNPYITIAGQTAPGGGITLAHGGGKLGRTPLIIKNTHDVIIRQLRVRNDRIGTERGSEDAITIEGSEYVIVDHVSTSWARDEQVNGYADNDFITVSNSIFAYGIPKHDKCALLGSDPEGPQHFSFIGNICAHNGDRNPDINFAPQSCVEVINNLFYNAQSEFAEIWETYGGTPVALVGNYFKAGPDTTPASVGIVRQTFKSAGSASIYMKDNGFEGAFRQVTPGAAELKRDAPPCPLTVKPLVASIAFDQALAVAGAWPRDAIDAQVISEVRKGTGRIVREPGAIPPIDAGIPYPDGDEDGMDDRWEVAHRADPKRFDAWADANGDGVANLDEFLDALNTRLGA